MSSQALSYSPNILIHFEIGEKTIRLSDVLCETATLYDSEFAEVPPGTRATLVVVVGDESERSPVVLDQGISRNDSVVHFSSIDDVESHDIDFDFGFNSR